MLHLSDLQGISIQIYYGSVAALDDLQSKVITYHQLVCNDCFPRTNQSQKWLIIDVDYLWLIVEHHGLVCTKGAF